MSEFREDFGIHVTVGHALMLHSIGLGRPMREDIPPQVMPDLVELDYGNSLVGIVARYRPAYKRLIDEVPRLIAAVPQYQFGYDSEELLRRLDAGEQFHLDAPFSRDILAKAREEITRSIKPEEMQQLARYYGERLSIQQRAQLAKQIGTGLGVDVPISDRWISNILETFSVENAALISSIPENLHQELANLTIRAYAKRMSPETFGALVEERFGVAESRARFIAAQELGKLHGQVNAARQQSLGITHYFWKTRRDSRVRPSHARLEGRRFAYQGTPKPPVGLPGDDYGCRCHGQPDLSGIIAAIRSRRVHEQPIASSAFNLHAATNRRVR